MTLFRFALGLLLACATPLAAALAQGPDRLPMMTALFDDVEPALRAVATCRMSGLGFSEKALKRMEASLQKAGLQAPDISRLMQRLEGLEPMIDDDRSVAEALAFCSVTMRDDRFNIQKAFSLIDKLEEAANVAPGRDDAQIIDVMKKIVAERNGSVVCAVSETGPLPKRQGIPATGDLGKELARFDISVPVRSYIDTLFSADADFSAFNNVGALRAHCRARNEAFAKNMQDGKKLPPPPTAKLKALQPLP